MSVDKLGISRLARILKGPSSPGWDIARGLTTLAEPVSLSLQVLPQDLTYLSVSTKEILLISLAFPFLSKADPPHLFSRLDVRIIVLSCKIVVGIIL